MSIRKGNVYIILSSLSHIVSALSPYINYSFSQFAPKSCITFDEQRQWLDVLEETKKKKAAIDNQRKEAAVAAAAADRSSGISLDSTNREAYLYSR